MTFAAVVLAAGKATRFGSDKLSAPLEGEPLLHHAIRAARVAPVERVMAVTREETDLGEWPGTPPVRRVVLASEELSASLKAGITAIGNVDGAFVFLGDMPRVPHGLADRLADALGANFAAMPRHKGRMGHPVLLSSRSFVDIARLTGDAGAGMLLKTRNDIAYVECDNPGVLLDVDHPDDLQEF